MTRQGAGSSPPRSAGVCLRFGVVAALLPLAPLSDEYRVVFRCTTTRRGNSGSELLDTQGLESLGDERWGRMHFVDDSATAVVGV